MKQKIKLDELRIQSFVTELDAARADKAKGGSMYGGNSAFYGMGNCDTVSGGGGGSYGTGAPGNTQPYGGGGTGGQAPDYSYYCSQDYDDGGRCI
jgi:hypothetical protein